MGRNQATNPCKAVQTAAGEASVHTEGKWKAAAVGDTDGSGQGHPAGGGAGTEPRL